MKSSLTKCLTAMTLSFVPLISFLNPDWFLSCSPLFSNVKANLLLIIFSITLLRLDFKEMGQYKSGSFVGFSGFQIGMMTAIFQVSGTYDDSSRVLNRWRVWFLLCSLRFWSMCLLMRSHPIAWLLKISVGGFYGW